MSRKLLFAVFILLMAIASGDLYGQACSCGGAPLVGSLQIPSSESGSWRIGITYDYSSISDVISGSMEFADDSRKRSVHSGLVEIGYGISNRLSISTLFAVLQQDRVSGSSQGAGESLRTRGIGDGLILLKYNLIPFDGRLQRQLSFGGGAKIPLGKTGLTANSSLISADMQPGTGSWDAVLWGYGYQGFGKNIPVGMFATGSYRVTGSNDRFGLNRQGYKFGNDFKLTFGISGKLIQSADITLGLNYRSAKPDRFENLKLPNSGGHWLDIEPGFTLRATELLSFRAAGRIPVSRQLEGTQLTTSYRLSFSILYSILPKRSEFDL